MTESTPILAIDGLKKTYASIVAVDGLSFTIEPGEFVGFIGPNGAGKSTTMRSIVGLLEPDSGSLRVDGVDVRADPVGARTKVGYVPQELELYRYLTGEELLRFVASIRGVPEEEVDARIESLLKLCELSDARNRLVREYSGGMSRKIAIASALIAEPPLLLLDESFVGLDPESTYRIRRHLERIVESGRSVLLSSHILDMLERICSRVIVLHQGRIVADLGREALHEAIGTTRQGDLTSLYLELTGQEHLFEE